MARKVTSRRIWVSTAAAWLCGFVIFLPILWMVLTSFKTELDAFAMPPKFLFFHWTTENYATVQSRSDYVHHALNSIIIAGGSTLVALLIAVPAAWSMAFAPTKRTKDILLWMLSTKMMPPVGVLRGVTGRNQSLPLDVGNVLVLGSDGLTEQEDPAGAMYGYDRFERKIVDLSGLSLRNMGTRLIQDVTGFARGTPPSDDRTLVLFRSIA